MNIIIGYAFWIIFSIIELVICTIFLASILKFISLFLLPFKNCIYISLVLTIPLIIFTLIIGIGSLYN